MKTQIGVEAIKLLKGRSFESLTPDEIKTLNFFTYHGRKHGVRVEMKKDADAISLANAQSHSEAEIILKNANVWVDVFLLTQPAT